MRVFRNRYILGGLCLLLAAAIAFFLLPQIAQNREATTMVLRAAKNIQPGTEITEQDITTVEVGAFNLPPDTLADAAQVVGKYSRTSISANDYFFTGKLSDEQYTTLMEQAVGNQQRLLTVTLSSIAAGTGGHLQAGDTVAAWYFKPETQKQEPAFDGMERTVTIPAAVVAPPILQRITLYALENTAAESIDSDEERDLLVADSQADKKVPTTATLMVTDEQAAELLLAEYIGKLHLVFVDRGAE
jgi:pilus assembly protein CpaB